MRQLNTQQQDMVAGGGAVEFRSIIRHDIPRFDEPHEGLRIELQQSGDSPEIEVRIPLRWLPPWACPGDVR